MDSVDQAQALTASLLENALRRDRSRRIAIARQPGCDRCLDCGEEISAERKAAVPNARRCVDCAVDRESGGRWK